jgi:Leucine-rich repeat (LRR) protein
LETWAPFANQAGLLDLSNRNITAVPVNAFKGMPSLVKLSLRENQLSTLPSGVFADLSSLRSLVCLREFESVLVRVCLSLALSHMHF